MNLSNDELAKVARNKALLEKYPWLTPYNVWTGKPLEDYNYEYTWADDIPRGWRLAFAKSRRRFKITCAMC